MKSSALAKLGYSAPLKEIVKRKILSTKQQFNKHNSDFRNTKTQDATTLSTYIWKLKAEQVNYETTWRIVTKTKSFSPAARYCNLCKVDDIGTHSVCQLQNIGTQGRLCFSVTPSVCVPQNAVCVSPILRTQLYF